jgi:predicted O-linked N-acetylglucosamine transferase (SPINDLY family)
VYSQRLKEISARLRENPMDAVWAGHLLKTRHEIAKAFLSARPEQLEVLYKGDAGKAHGMLLSMGITGYPPLPQEHALISSIARQVSQGPKEAITVNMVLAAMAYEGPHKLLTCEVLPLIPSWLLDGFLKYVFGVPWLFKEKGEVELHYQHLSRWVNHLHTHILGNRTSAYWREVLRGFMSHTNFMALYFTWHNLREIYRQRGELIQFALELWGCRPDFTFSARDKGAGKIRFGILSPMLTPRAETFATLPIYAHLDRREIEVILLVPARREKAALEAYCVSRADRLEEIPDDLFSSVEAIRALDLDAIWIGGNLSVGSSRFVNLSAHRLARVQLTGGCSPTTTGLRNIDVFVSGTLSEPPDAREHYTEKLICLDGPVICYDFGPVNDETTTRIIDRSELNIPEKAVVYASGTNFFKIIPELEETWIRILAATPDSRLLLYPFNPNWMTSYPAGPFLHRISATCKRLGVNGNRLAIIPPLPAIADIRAMLGNVADVYLDSFPHSGMTSLVDPLLAGIPTVVLEGNSQRSKMASGAMRDMGIPELVAGDQEACLQLALRLGREKDFRRLMAQEIRQRIAKPPKFLDARWCGAEMTRLLKSMVFPQSR